MSNINDDNKPKRESAMNFDRQLFTKLVINDLNSSSSGRAFLRKYKQSEVREIVENYKLGRNQDRLREISQLLYAKSPQYQRLVKYFADMALFQYVVSPVKDIRDANKKKVTKQYIEIAELARRMNLKHEMKKALRTAYREDVFYGYIHEDKKGMYIQKIEPSIAKITSVEDGIYNFSINMSIFEGNEKYLKSFANEVSLKYFQWKSMKQSNRMLDVWVELSPENTICIKINEDMMEIFPPFAGSFDSIFDIEAFKELRKNKEELGNYMVMVQKLPMRQDSDDNNDFMIDGDTMLYFHNMAIDTVPDNVGVITSPMEIEPVKFDKDRVDSDGVAKAERDFWSSSGTAQLLFNADGSTSQGLLMSIKTDEQVVFSVVTQTERWVNRFLSHKFKDLYFNINILHTTEFNKKDTFNMYKEAGQYGLPVRNHLSAVVGLSPIETLNMAYLENDILGLDEMFIPLKSSHTMTNDSSGSNDGGAGQPEKDLDELSDEGARTKDKQN